MILSVQWKYLKPKTLQVSYRPKKIMYSWGLSHLSTCIVFDCVIRFNNVVIKISVLASWAANKLIWLTEKFSVYRHLVLICNKSPSGLLKLSRHLINPHRHSVSDGFSQSSETLTFHQGKIDGQPFQYNCFMSICSLRDLIRGRLLENMSAVIAVECY